MRTSKALLSLLLTGLFCAGPSFAEDAQFYRGINLNGPGLQIEGHAWDGDGAKDFSANGKRFENQKVALRPPADTARTQMIRSSVWGDKVDLELTNVPAGK